MLVTQAMSRPGVVSTVKKMHLLNVSVLVIHIVSCNCMSLAGR
jgi:hypothetical protein